MKKSVFALTLLATLLLCGCEGALEPNEEPFIRGKGIEDRVYLVSEGNPEKNVTCTILFNENLLVLTFDKEVSFTASLWNSGKYTMTFCKKFTNATTCSINLAEFEDGSYTLYIDNSFICQFYLENGSKKESKGIEYAEEATWFDSDGMFVEVKYSFLSPELDFSSALYPFSAEELEDWPFGKVGCFMTSMAYRGGIGIEDSMLIIEHDSIPRTRWHFSLGTEFILRTASHGSFLPDNTQDGNIDGEGDKPRLGGQTFSYDGKPIDDLWTSYTRGFMLPTTFKDFSKQTDERGKITYISEMSDTIRPATMPYLIEIIDGTNEMASVQDIYASGFATQYSLSVCEPTTVSGIMAADEILPAKDVPQSDGTTIQVAAAKLRTWGRAGDSPVSITFTAVFDNGTIESFSTDVTDQVARQPQGGVITIYVPIRQY